VRMAGTGMMSGGSMMTGRIVVACRSMMMVILNSLVRHTGGVMDLGGVMSTMCSHLASVMGGWSVMSSYMVGAMVSIMVSAVVVMMPTRAIC